MTKEEAIARLASLSRGNEMRDDEFTTVEYAQQNKISRRSALDQLNSLLARGLVTRRMITLNGHLQVAWRAVEAKSTGKAGTSKRRQKK